MQALHVLRGRKDNKRKRGTSCVGARTRRPLPLSLRARAVELPRVLESLIDQSLYITGNLLGGFCLIVRLGALW